MGRLPPSPPSRPGPTPAEMYDQYFGPAMFEPWAHQLLARAAPGAGERALDLACGTGIVARQLAPLIGPAGRLVALDLRSTMLTRARRRPAPGGAVARWLRGDALALPLADGVFDLVVCQQGLQFFPDRPQALREVRRVLAAGGRAAFAVWRELARQSLFQDVVAAEVRHLAPLGVTEGHAAAPFRLGDAGELASLFEQAGFAAVEVQAHTQEVHFPDPDRFVANNELAYAAVMPEYLTDPATFAAYLAAIERDLAPALQRHRRGDRLSFPMQSHLVLARAPEQTGGP
jgi:ubiquinone/menaquinone biosynthesis C-methylase UbiE